jgi:coenzyme PQQ precursor peptide PqqA
MSLNSLKSRREKRKGAKRRQSASPLQVQGGDHPRRDVLMMGSRHSNGVDKGNICRTYCVVKEYFPFLCAAALQPRFFDAGQAANASHQVKIKYSLILWRDCRRKYPGDNRFPRDHLPWMAQETKGEAVMKWVKPAYCDLRLGFEVTAYVYVR